MLILPKRIRSPLQRRMQSPDAQSQWIHGRCNDHLQHCRSSEIFAVRSFSTGRSVPSSLVSRLMPLVGRRPHITRCWWKYPTPKLHGKQKSPRQTCGGDYKRGGTTLLGEKFNIWQHVKLWKPAFEENSPCWFYACKSWQLDHFQLAMTNEALALTMLPLRRCGLSSSCASYETRCLGHKCCHALDRIVQWNSLTLAKGKWIIEQPVYKTQDGLIEREKEWERC